MPDNSRCEGTRVSGTLRAHPVAVPRMGADLSWLAILATGAAERLREGAGLTRPRPLQ